MFLESRSFDAMSDLPRNARTRGGLGEISRDRERLDDPAAGQRCKIMVLMPLSSQRGGGELMFLDLIEHGRELNIDWLAVFMSDGPMVQTVRKWGVEAVVIDAGRLRQPHRVVMAIIKIRRLIRTRGVDVVINWIAKSHLYGGTAAMLAGVPAVWYQLGYPDPPSVQERLATAVPACGILTCSDSASEAQKKLWPDRAVRTVYPGVSLQRFDPERLPSPLECRRQLGLPVNGALIGIVGRLQRWKGMHHVIGAMPGVLREFPDCHCVIIGGEHAFEPDYPAFLKRRVAEANLVDHVSFAGLQHNVPHWMQAMDVVVHASDKEPFGIVVVEAMALGKPVAATNTAGPTEIICPGIDGLLWTAGDPDSLRLAVLELLADRKLRQRIGRAARNKAASFSSGSFARRVVENVFDLVRAAGKTLGSQAGNERMK
jgi:glycosyltransferase involved in cell wall biosynthesis